MTIKGRVRKLEEHYKPKGGRLFVVHDDCDNPDILTVEGELMTRAEFEAMTKPDDVVILISRYKTPDHTEPDEVKP